MAKQPNEDLFADTTMTFGEHLEELRVSLIRALIGLVIGFLIGLFVAHHVVRWIQEPLQQALKKNFVETSKQRIRELYPNGVSGDLDRFMAEHSLVFEEVYVEKSQLRRWASQGDTGPNSSEGKAIEAPDVALPPPDIQMVKTRIWRAAQSRITSLSPEETFMIWLKASFVSGVIIASPYMFFEIWVFVAAGLYPHEKKFIHLFLPFSLLLFLGGAATAFFFAFGPVLNFLFSFGRAMNIDPDLRISEVVSFVLILPLGFGISFQLPLVMFFLHRIGVFSVAAYIAKWRIAILAIFVIAMVLTPADPISMLLMAMPLTVLYFLGVGLCHWFPRSRSPFAAAYEP